MSTFEIDEVRQAIDFLMGVDRTEYWPKDLGYSPSPEEWGMHCVYTLEKMDQLSDEALVALFYGAMHDTEDDVRAGCGHAIRKIDKKLAIVISLIQIRDDDWDVRGGAIEEIWDRASDLARRVCEQMSTVSCEERQRQARYYLKMMDEHRRDNAAR